MYVTTGKTSNQAKALQLKQKAQRDYDTIRADRSLSQDGKREQLARAWWSNKRELDKLEMADLAGRKFRREDLFKELFGSERPVTGSDIISARDAADRASQIDSQEEAGRLLSAARMSGDVTLARAVAQQAYANQWTGALENWADGDAGIEAKINELYEIDAAGSRNTAGLAQLLAHGMAFESPKPDEIDGLSGAQVDQLVGEATSEYSAPAVQRTNFGHSQRANDYALNSPQVETDVATALSQGE